MKTVIITLLLSNLLFFSIIGCSAKTKPTISEINIPNADEIKIANIVDEILAEDQANEESLTQFGAVGADSTLILEKYSLYIEYFKQGAFKDAYPHWQYLFENAPSFNKGIYINGADMITDFIKAEKNPKRKEVLIDSLMLLYDRRIKNFEEEGFVLGKKGSDLFTYRPSAYEQAYGFLIKSIELEGSNSSRTAVFTYIYTTTFMKKNNKIDDQQLIDNFLKANEIIQANIASDSKWENVYNNILELIKDYLKCDVLTTNFGKLKESNNDNLNMLKKFLSVMEARSCIENTTYIGILERVNELEPSASSSYSLGNYYLVKDNSSKAITFLSQALDQEENLETKYKYAMKLAEAYKKAGNNTTARFYCTKAAGYQPSEGYPYIFIGDLYATSAKSCGSSPFETQSVYWAAVDQYVIAKSKGHPDAAERINIYTNSFPTKEGAFYQDPPVKEGDAVSIGCWIGVTTTARFVK